MKISDGRIFSAFGLSLWRQPAFVISSNPIWVVIDKEGWLYADESLLKLAWSLITEWRSDRHIVG